MSDRCKPFFQYIKRSSTIVWGEEQDKALAELKLYLSHPPILASPADGQRLYAYLAVSEVAISAVQFIEKDSKQKPVFYASRMHLDTEMRYSMVEKLVLALVNAKKRLRQYFEAHSITVYTDFPIRQILAKPDLSERLTKWAIELGIYDIEYRPRVAKKGQVMADFLVEIQSFGEPHAPLQTSLPHIPSAWTLYTDRSMNASESGIIIVLQTLVRLRIEKDLRLSFQAMNNEAEYEVLLQGLELALHFEVKSIAVKTDSQLIVG
ncbi:Ribonuclease H [Parasponia andersonii]|uniref:Ribonuclease H n=1 Tax=Parasponia andersonii TaxID=3476 RepID=A0A2P5E269_PARAD|nr:Ribonuclease H [Parasponia andersonii]